MIKCRCVKIVPCAASAFTFANDSAAMAAEMDAVPAIPVGAPIPDKWCELVFRLRNDDEGVAPGVILNEFLGRTHACPNSSGTDARCTGSSRSIRLIRSFASELKWLSILY